MSGRRVAITGVGAICALGNDMATIWPAIKAGRSGATSITRYDISDVTVKIACEVKDFDAQAKFGRDVKKIDLFTQYGLVASDEAVADSGIDFEREDPARCGAIIGTGMGGLNEIEKQHLNMLDRGSRRVSPHFIPKLMINAIAGHVSIRYGLKGPSYITASACASASHAMGLAFRSIREGHCDAMVTGGTEAVVTKLAMSGFANMKAMSTRNEAPEKASRPFDKDRDGFVMGEGAGMLIFEELEHAKARGAKIYAEVKGFGMTADAHHITAPTPGGEGPAAAMQEALEDGQVDPERVNFINAHGTSTSLNDAAETRAIRSLFGDHADKLAINSSKSMIGHLMGASGGLEMVLCAHMVQDSVLHPTINYETPDPECDLDCVPNEARDFKIDHALCNALGFGGHNVSLLFARYDG